VKRNSNNPTIVKAPCPLGNTIDSFFVLVHHPTMPHLTSEQRHAQVVCGMIREFGRRIGFPVATLATAQLLFHITARSNTHKLKIMRQGLDHQHPVYSKLVLVQAAALDATCACLLVSGKVHDTAKKLRDVLPRAFSWSQNRHVELNPDSEVSTGITLEFRFLFNVTFALFVNEEYQYT
jgi:hypothetical protein